MSNSSSNFPWTGIIFIGCIIVLIMWIFDAGPFEKSYVPTTNYSSPYSSGSQVSFGSSNTNGSYTVSAYFQDGSYACEVTVKNGLAYPNGSSQGSQMHTAGYNYPGTYWCFWAHRIIYF